MKTFTQYINEMKNIGKGDCMRVAANIMMEYHTPYFGTQLKANGSPILVHALVHGQGPLRGRRYFHAWVEDNDIVIDKSNGRENAKGINKLLYYAIGGIKPKERGAYKTYAFSDMKKKLTTTKHYGPWDLDENLEEDNVFPTSKVKIGKTRLGVDSKLLKALRESINEAIITDRPTTAVGGRSWTHAQQSPPAHATPPVTANDLKRLESVLDSMFRAANLDIAFTRHFLERINGSRGYGGTVTITEILDAFRKTYNKYAKEIEKHPVDWKAIINDVGKELNMPFTLDWNGRMKKMVMVTAMKKREFMSADPKLKV